MESAHYLWATAPRCESGGNSDEAQAHYGTIYQGGNWTYLGPRKTHAYRIHGELVHGKTVAMRHGSQAVPWLRANVDRRAERVNLPPKHKYVMPLDDRVRRRIERLSMPYPKRAGGAAAARRSTRPKTAVRLRPRRLNGGHKVGARRKLRA